MRITYPETVTSSPASTRAGTLDLGGLRHHLPLAAIVLLAAVLRFANLASLGYVNHYYAAAMESMLQSWHNLFFVAAEPGGAVSVDKPPVGLWIQAISARVFGVNSFGLLLPEILAGLISIVIVYHLVRRRFGTAAGLTAALALAITPVAVATDRNNTIDSVLIMTLLLAAWAFIAATEQGRLRYLLAGAVLVGIAFNIKMLEAYLPLPAFYALYFLGSKEMLWRKLANLAGASVLLAVVSLSWAVVVDLTPADQRPYVGSSGDNSVMSLAIGYNGTQRLLGMGGRGGILSGLFGGNQAGGFSGRGQSRSQGPTAGNQPQPGQDGRAFQQPGPGTGGNAPQPGQGDGRSRQINPGGGSFQPRAQGQGGAGAFGGGPGGGAGGMFGTGQTGALRLFTGSLAKDIGWLLPFGLFGAVLLASSARPRWPIAPKHRALVLWGGWLLTGGAFFSVAGFFHEYYLSVLAPPLAALVGIGTMELWDMRRRHRWIAPALAVLAATGTLALQLSTAGAFTKVLWWLPAPYALLAAGAVLLIAAASRNRQRAGVAGLACILAALMVTPAVWSALANLNPSDNQSLPAAYSGRPSAVPNNGGLQVNRALLDYLQANTQGTKYLLAVPSSMQGSDYVLATGRPVLYLGGFMGQDRVVTPDDLSRMVADGELRYIYWNSSGSGGFGTQSDISAWVAANCVPVSGFDTRTQNSGAPGGTSAGGATTGGFPGGGAMQITLYQCVASTKS